jgi:hypothetical protein
MASSILWTQHAKVQREVRRQVGGKIVVEKIPQRGHAGGSDYDKPTIQAGQRWAHVVDHAGNAVRVPLTTGASLFVDDGEEQGNYARIQRMKFRALGWYPVGSCPCALLLSGEMRTSHFADQDVAAQAPCKPKTYSEREPCPHAVAEQKARQKQQHALMLEKAEKFKPEVEKILAGQREQTKEIAAAITESMGSTVKSILEATRAAPADPPEKGAKK